MTRTRATATALVLAGLLAACGGGAKGTDADGKAPGTTVAGKGGASGLPLWDENRKMNDTTGYSSPLSTAMGFDLGSADQAAEQAKYREREQTRQEAMAACMREQGFTYTPYVPDDAFTSFTPPAYELTRKEFVEKYGFGISTMTKETMAPQPDKGPEPEDDPNYVYQQSLPQSDQEAYNKALYGDQTAVDGPAGGGAADDSGGDGTTEATIVAGGQFKPAGCAGKAEEAMNGGPASEADQSFLDEFNKRVDALYQKVQADKRVVDATRAYASCMADKGLPEIDKQETAYQKVSDRMQPLWESQGMGGGMTDEGRRRRRTIAVSGGDGSGGPQFDPAKLAEVNAYELAVAKADLACGKDVMKTQYEVQQELEQQFVAENAADLARYKTLSDNGLAGRG